MSKTEEIYSANRDEIEANKRMLAEISESVRFSDMVRIMAAAPHLLEALESFLAADSPDEIIEAKKIAKKAIVKATGDMMLSREVYGQFW